MFVKLVGWEGLFVNIGMWFVMVCVTVCSEIGNQSANLAQVSQARPGESCRVSTLILLEPLAQAEVQVFGRHVISPRRVQLT